MDENEVKRILVQYESRIVKLERDVQRIFAVLGRLESRVKALENER